MVEPSDKDLVLKFDVAYQTGPVLYYTLTKDGLETRFQDPMPRQNVNEVKKIEKHIDMDAFWQQYSPMIDKVIEDSNNGIEELRTVTLVSCQPFHYFTVRSRDESASARVCVYGQLRKGITLEGHFPNLPDEYVDLYEFMRDRPEERRPTNPTLLSASQPSNRPKKRSCCTM